MLGGGGGGSGGGGVSSHYQWQERETMPARTKNCISPVCAHVRRSFTKNPKLDSFLFETDRFSASRIIVTWPVRVCRFQSVIGPRVATLLATFFRACFASPSRFTLLWPDFGSINIHSFIRLARRGHVLHFRPERFHDATTIGHFFSLSLSHPARPRVPSRRVQKRYSFTSDAVSLSWYFYMWSNNFYFWRRRKKCLEPIFSFERGGGGRGLKITFK